MTWQYINNAPFICNHCPPLPPPPMGNSGDNKFLAIITLLKALHCKDLLRVIAPLFIIVNSTGVSLYNVTSQAGHCGRTQKVTALHIRPAIPSPSPKVCIKKIAMTAAQFCHELLLLRNKILPQTSTSRNWAFTLSIVVIVLYVCILVLKIFVICWVRYCL